MVEDKFASKRNEAFDRMIQERKSEWDLVENEKERLKEKIGELQAKLMFMDNQGKNMNNTYGCMKTKLSELINEYNEFVERNTGLANKLNKEMDELLILKNQPYNL